MKARLYVRHVLVGEAEVSDVPLYGCKDGRPVAVGDAVTVAIIDDHPTPNQRPLFLTGLLETA